MVIKFRPTTALLSGMWSLAGSGPVPIAKGGSSLFHPGMLCLLGLLLELKDELERTELKSTDEGIPGSSFHLTMYMFNYLLKLE